VNAFFVRARNLLLDPDTEWRRIAGERPSMRTLFVTHVGPLAAVFALGPMVGAMLFPELIQGVRVTPGPLNLIVEAILNFAIVCGGLYALAWFIDWIAPRFGGKRDFESALKLSTYSSTAMLATGVFGIIPAFGLLTLAGLWSLHTFFKGAPILMQSDDDKSIPFTASVAGVVVVVSLLVGAIFYGARQAAAGDVAQNRPAQTDARTTDAGPVRIQPATLRRLMPEALIGGWYRRDLVEDSGGVMGFTGATVAGVFVLEHKTITLRLVDLGADPRVADLAAVLKQSAKGETADGYDRIIEAPGRLVVERLNRTKGTVERLTILNNRLVLHGEGANVSEAELNAALATIGEFRLEALSKGGG
jgi:hypothetical protein